MPGKYSTRHFKENCAGNYTFPAFMYSGLLSYYDWDGLRAVLVLDTHDVCARIYRLHINEAHCASLLNRT